MSELDDDGSGCRGIVGDGGPYDGLEAASLQKRCIDVIGPIQLTCHWDACGVLPLGGSWSSIRVDPRLLSLAAATRLKVNAVLRLLSDEPEDTGTKDSESWEFDAPIESQVGTAPAEADVDALVVTIAERWLTGIAQDITDLTEAVEEVTSTLAVDVAAPEVSSRQRGVASGMSEGRIERGVFSTLDLGALTERSLPGGSSDHRVANDVLTKVVPGSVYYARTSHQSMACSRSKSGTGGGCTTGQAMLWERIPFAPHSISRWLHMPPEEVEETEVRPANVPNTTIPDHKSAESWAQGAKLVDVEAWLWGFAADSAAAARKLSSTDVSRLLLPMAPLRSRPRLDVTVLSQLVMDLFDDGGLVEAHLSNEAGTSAQPSTDIASTMLQSLEKLVKVLKQGLWTERPQIPTSQNVQNVQQADLQRLAMSLEGLEHMTTPLDLYRRGLPGVPDYGLRLCAEVGSSRTPSAPLSLNVTMTEDDAEPRAEQVLADGSMHAWVDVADNELPLSWDALRATTREARVRRRKRTGDESEDPRSAGKAAGVPDRASDAAVGTAFVTETRLFRGVVYPLWQGAGAVWDWCTIQYGSDGPAAASASTAEQLRQRLRRWVTPLSATTVGGLPQGSELSDTCAAATSLSSVDGTPLLDGALLDAIDHVLFDYALLPHQRVVHAVVRCTEKAAHGQGSASSDAAVEARCVSQAMQELRGEGNTHGAPAAESSPAAAADAQDWRATLLARARDAPLLRNRWVLKRRELDDMRTPTRAKGVQDYVQHLLQKNWFICVALALFLTMRIVVGYNAGLAQQRRRAFGAVELRGPGR